MATIDNAIEAAYRELSGSISYEYSAIYDDVPNEKLKVIFSTIHACLVYLFGRMNERLPSGEEGAYYWADESRNLRQCISVARRVQRTLQGTPLAFTIENYYDEQFAKCDDFLRPSNGSNIPPHMEKIELYYTDRIFLMNNKAVPVETPQIKNITRDYISGVAKRAFDDIDNKNFDSAITKCRTLLEETFCYVIELKHTEPSDSGDIGKLYNQVKQLYNMHHDPGTDKRVHTLLSGLEKIVSAIAEMRNKESDAHGVGQRRIGISDYHARLFVNSAVTMADFILAVAEKQCS